MGTVIHRGSNFVVADVGGVGYKVFVAHPEKLKESAELWTHHYVREDQQALYGFGSPEELEVFELLITVSGVGPKAAMAILRAGKREEIVEAIEQNNPAWFRAVPSIGAKVAAKIIVELKSKISNGGVVSPVLMDEHEEVIGALQALGYREREIVRILPHLPAKLSTQEKIKFCLRKLAR